MSRKVFLLASILGSMALRPLTAAEAPLLLLDDVVERALRLNPELAAQRKEISEADGNVKAAKALPNPYLSTTLDYIPLSKSANTPKGVSIGVMQTLPTSGRRGASITWAESMKRSASLTFEDRKRLFTLDVRLSYWDLVYRKQVFEFERRFHANYEDFVRTNKVRLDKGDLSETEYKKLELGALGFRRSLEEERVRLAEARSRLRDLAVVEESEWDVADTLDGWNAAAAVSVPLETLLKLRTDVSAAEAAVTLAQHELELREAEKYPDVDVGLVYHGEPRGGGFKASNYFGVAVNVPLKIFDRNEGQIDAARARYEQSVLLRESVIKKARTDLENQKRQIESDLELYKIYREKLRTNEEVYQKMRYAYLKGAAPISLLLESERAYNEIQKAYLEVIYELIKDSETYQSWAGWKKP